MTFFIFIFSYPLFLYPGFSEVPKVCYLIPIIISPTHKSLYDCYMIEVYEMILHLF